MSDINTPNGEESAERSPPEPSVGRRNAFRGLASAAAATVATGAAAGAALAQAPDAQGFAPSFKNPYRGGPNTGITLPPYYRPTPSVANANTFFPGVEELGADEMRISFVGSAPIPPTRVQCQRRSKNASAGRSKSTSRLMA